MNTQSPNGCTDCIKNNMIPGLRSGNAYIKKKKKLKKVSKVLKIKSAFTSAITEHIDKKVNV